MGVVSNKIKREELKSGDHIYSWRLSYIYAHHGIYIGEGKVIHFTRGAGQEIGTGTVLDRIIFSSAPYHLLDIPCPNCDDQSKLEGVISSCIDCFLSGGNLYRFEYGVTPAFFLAKARGGTCTLAPSDPPEDVLHRTFFLLQNGFGGYHIFRNNCEDFAIYCKTGLLIIPIIGVGRSGQAASFLALSSAVSASLLKFLSHSFSGAAAVGMYCASRLASDVGVRSNVAKVPVERLVADFALRNSDSEGEPEITLPVKRLVAESGLSETNSEGRSEIDKKDSLPVELLVVESDLGNLDSEGGSEIGKKYSLPVKKLVAESSLSNSISEGGSEIGKKDSLPVKRLVAESGLGNLNSESGSEIS